MQDVANIPQPLTAYDTILGIRDDLYVANHALCFEEEMPEKERGGIHFTIERIILRMDDLIGRAEEQLNEIPLA